MSSRVQKGNTIFKPTVKPRGRTVAPIASRQPSVAVEQQPPAESLKPPSLTNAALLAVNTSESQITLPRPSVNVIPTVIATPSRAPPPVLIQVNVNAPSPRSVDVQSVTPMGREPSFYGPMAIQSTNGTQTALISDTDAASPSSPGLVIPMTIPFGSTPSATLHESSEVQDQQAGPSKTRRRRKDSEEHTIKSKKSKTSKSPEVEMDETDSRSRGSSKTPRPRRRAPSPPPFDPDANPGEEIDPTAVTMAALCVDTGQGRISSKAAEIVSNHAAWKLKNREKRGLMRAMMEAKKSGRPDDEYEDTPNQIEEQPSIPTNSAPPSTTPAATDNTGHDFDYSQDLTTSRYNVQVRIGPNGETVIDEDSLIVDRMEHNGTENFTHVTESDQTKFVNSATYGKRFRGSRWSAEETELFYDALSQYGENYELIAYVLPGRDRKACKNKFKAEDKKNPARISYCLDNSIPVDISTLSRMTGKDFSGPVPEIRAPPPPPLEPTVQPEDEVHNSTPKEGTSRLVEKKSRSKSRGVSDGDVVVIGNAEDFQS